MASTAPGGELIGRIAAGETVGEMGLIVSRPRTATVRALRDSELATLSAGTFERVLLGHPEAILRLARLTVTRLEDREAEQASHHDARARSRWSRWTRASNSASTRSRLVQALSRFGRVDLVSARARRQPQPAVVSRARIAE